MSFHEDGLGCSETRFVRNFATLVYTKMFGNFMRVYVVLGKKCYRLW